MDWLGHPLLLLAFLLALSSPEGPSSVTPWITASLKKLESQWLKCPLPGLSVLMGVIICTLGWQWERLERDPCFTGHFNNSLSFSQLDAFIIG